MKRSSLHACLLALCFALVSAQTEALTLGRLRVLSPLGQALNAEIDISDITAEEANSLRIAIAGPDAFKSAGLEYNAATANITISGKRRPDGRAYLELRNNSVVNDPFMDLVLEISWATGRMVRDYTLLFDPPIGNIAAVTKPPNPTLPITHSTPVPSPTLQAAPTPPGTTNLGSISARTNSGVTVNGGANNSRQPATAASLGSFSVSTAGVGAKTRVASAKSVKPSKSNKASYARNADNDNLGNEQIVVKKGDTAATLAMAEKAEGVSLDQMLVAMLKSNPDAFINGNIHRLKTGVVLDIPTQDQALALSPAEAKNSLQVQSSDFNEYRKNLANNVTAEAANTSNRDAAGKVTAKVDDKKLSNTAPDRLTLAKPDTAKKLDTEDKIAIDRSNTQIAGRKLELEKNLTDLAKIATPAAASTPAVDPVLPPPPPPPIALQVDTSKAMPSSAPMAPSASNKTTSWLDQLINHPLTLWIGGLVALLLLAAAWVRARQRNKLPDTLRAENSMNFAPSQQATQTVFGAMGANQVNTQESLSSTMVYPPSQFSTGTGDVDPIAEADVYLAYNRDVQAEEILKEAKQTTPKRTDVYVKLLEVYVKRHDMESFDSTAQELHLICDGEGAQWARARELAREIRSSSALFAVSGASFAATDTPHIQSAYANNSLSFTPSVQIHASSTAPIASQTQPFMLAQGTNQLIDFDLSALTLDLPQAAPFDTHAHAYVTQQPLVAIENAKLALAEEYLSIGDKAGARSLIQEVLAEESNPDIVAQANQMLSRIG